MPKNKATGIPLEVPSIKALYEKLNKRPRIEEIAEKLPVSIQIKILMSIERKLA